MHRYVHGPTDDEPLVQYEGSGTSTRRWLLADERGSVIGAADGAGGLVSINTYDEYGQPGVSNAGRFLQTDPIGYAGGLNLYAYVGNDR